MSETTEAPQRVLFICTHNSARSQMAQGLLNWLAPERYSAFSAGTHASQQVHPLAVQAMAELGVNILPQGVHSLDDYRGQTFDYVITVCDSAAEECPFFPGARWQMHWGFADPVAARGDEETRLAAFRHTRDFILVRLRHWLAETSSVAADPFARAQSPVTAPVPPAVSAASASATPEKQERVLILCTGNSARSQMAEGWLRYLGGTAYRVFSAGTHPTSVNPLAIEVMAERGIDIRHQWSKSVTEFTHQPFAYVITVCDRAAEECPIFPGAEHTLHWSFPDPAAVEGDMAERLRAFREVRDALYFQFWKWLAGQETR